MSNPNQPRVWMPHVTVAAIVERNGRFLLIEEEISKLEREASDLDDLWKAEKAAAQGDARALMGLAGFLEQSALLAAAKGISSLDTLSRVNDLVNQVTGGLVAAEIVFFNIGVSW